MTHCNTVVHVKRSILTVAMPLHRRKGKPWCTAVGEPETLKALLPEEELVRKERDKVHKAGKRASETRA